MDSAYQWDLSAIFKDRETWNQAYTEAEGMISAVAALEGTLGSSSDALADGLGQITAASEKTERVYLYAFLRKSGDNGNSENQELEARALSLYVKLSAATSYVEPEILAIPSEVLNGYMASPRLATYRHYIDDLTRSRAHTLDAEREKMLALLGEARQTPSNCFDMLADVDIEFPEITDADGKKVQLSNGNYNVFRESSVRRVREEAFNGYLGTYKRYINTTAAMYGGSVKLDSYFASVRKFSSAREAALFESNVPVSVYDSLIDAVHDGLPYMRRYLELRKKALGCEKLDMFDLYTPMVGEVDYPMPYDEGKRLVKEALAPLGEMYGKLLDKAFEERWIDVYENSGKTSGAFSCGVYGVHPYVLLNYTDTLDDAFTIAHELGHAIHSYCSDTTQDYVNHDYKILVAEVASTVNEVLLTLYLLEHETDKRRRAHILNHFLEGFRTTIYRQTLFAEFERKSHEMYEAGEPLTASSLSAVYKALVAEYYAGADINEIMAVEWSYIPHFYNAFYVYQYATGFSSAVAIAKHIRETGDAEGYLRFLTLGGSDYPIEELKTAGVDLTSPEAVRSALKLFSDTIDELDALIASIG